MNIEKLFLSGVIPSVPHIVCRTESAASYIQGWVHTHLTHEPPVMVAEEWPTEIKCDAVAITPINVLGADIDPMADFSIKTVEKLSNEAKRLLNIMIRSAMAGKQLPIRKLTAALYNDQRPYSKRKTVDFLKELEANRLIMRVHEGGPYKLLFGRWRPDAAAAKAAGLEIEIK